MAATRGDDCKYNYGIKYIAYGIVIVMRTYVTNNPQIQKFDDLVTSREKTRAGFIQFALEKNRRSTPYIEEAKTFKIYASKAKSPEMVSRSSGVRHCIFEFS